MRLEARRLAFGYPGHPVGAQADLGVDRGEVLALLGPNGSGKTTLFKTLLGLLPPQGGDVWIAGQRLASLSRRRIAHHLAYVPQAHAPPFPFSVRDVVLMGRTARLKPFAQPTAQDHEVAQAALDTLGIAMLAAHDYTRISGGQRQLALIARALAQEADVLIMDEPTASLDFGNQARVLAHVAQLKSRGLAIVLSTHDPDHALSVATRVALLEGGRILADGKPEAVVTSASLSRIYGVPVGVERLASGRLVTFADMERSTREEGQPPRW